MKIKETIFKEHLRSYITKYIVIAPGECLLTEFTYKTFLEHAVQNNWDYSHLNKSYFVRIFANTLRDVFKGHMIKVTPHENVGNAAFSRLVGYSSMILENIGWLDITLSENCIDTKTILGHYSDLKEFRVHRPSSYLSPEISLQETLTKRGIQDILKRGQTMDYLKENLNHPRNIIQFCFGIASQNERIENKLAKLEYQNLKILNHNVDLQKQIQSLLEEIQQLKNNTSKK